MTNLGKSLTTLVRDYYLHMVLFVAILAMGGSLYYSEVMKLTPCLLCWYQRIAMYPQVLIALVGVLRKDAKGYLYHLPLSLIGGTISAYHYFLQRTGTDNAFGSCSVATPCSAIEIEYLGFITIPFMALVAFTLIAIISGAKLWLDRKSGDRK